MIDALYYFVCLVLPSLLLLKAGTPIRTKTLAIYATVAYLLTLLIVEVA